MKIVTTAQMRELDRRTIAAGTRGDVLMERAGRAVAAAAARLARCRNGHSILVFAGKGNNGGDAFVAARHLREAGFAVVVAVCCSLDEIKGDALTHYQHLGEVTVAQILSAKDALAIFDRTSPCVVVDGLLGTGIEGKPRSPLAEIIDAINFRELPVVAIDVPSGLNSDTGEAAGAVVAAAITVTMGLPKLGLVQPRALDVVGRLEVADIGIPKKFVDETDTEMHLIAREDVSRLLPARKRTAHKGDFGHVLVLAGSEGYTGAALLCAEAAARSGAGLVTLAVPRKIYSIVAAQCREVMPRPLPDTEAGSFSTAVLDGIDDLIARCNVVALGPGIGQHPATREFVHRLIARCLRPMVLDADALNAVAHKPAVLTQAKAPVVVTPHPGEMARLCGETAAQIQSHRWASARQFAWSYKTLTVLKGAGTVVARPDSQQVWLNATGNAGLAKGGTGDVLTGLLGGLLAQGLAPFDAARAAVYLHGLAADVAVNSAGINERSLLASDLLTAISGAFNSLQAASAQP